MAVILQYGSPKKTLVIAYNDTRNFNGSLDEALSEVSHDIAAVIDNAAIYPVDVNVRVELPAESEPLREQIAKLQLAMPGAAIETVVVPYEPDD
jgi:hypothetical protein